MKKEQELNGFDLFWVAYPRRVAKQAAMKMYARALKLTTADKIIAAARAYATERAGQDATYTKHPASWLNAGCWGDYDGGPGGPGEPKPAGFYASFTSAEREAWDAYGKATRGRDYPRDRAGGWFFPTRWPPGYETTQAAC